MADIENSKDLTSVLWSGADVLRSKMDANEYKNYLLGIVFYKYLSDSFLIKVYDLLYDEKPETLRAALDAYREALEDESAEELKEQLEEECHYVIEPELTYTYFAEAAKNNSFNREQLQKAFNNIEQSDPIFADLFADLDLYSNRLGTGDQKQSDTVASLIKVIDTADLLNSDAEILGNAYEAMIGWFASETGKKAGEFYTPQAVSKILTKIAIAGQEDKKGLFEEGFEGSEDEIRNAYERRRKGDNKNAILEAGKAFESTMKIICDKQGYAYDKNKDTVQKLITILENNGFYPSYKNAHLTSIRTTLETGLPVVRNKVVGHGQGNQIITIPDEYTDYALHLAATNILFLVRLYRNKKQNL